jgi:hypothetical protein
MKIIGSKKQTSYGVGVEIDGREYHLEVGIEPADGLDAEDYALHIVGHNADKLVLGYLANDTDCPHPLEDCDEMGHIYENFRFSPTAGEFRRALGLGDDDGEVLPGGGDPYAVLLDCYDHGGRHWSLSGGGMQCQFDTSRAAGVWVPDEGLIGYLEDLPEEERAEQAIVYAKQALEEYNAWLRGDCYGYVMAVYNRVDGDWEMDFDESSWGIIGRQWALAEMRSEVQAVVKQLEKRMEEAHG